MEQLTVTLPDEIATQLRTAAKNSGVKPEDFMLASLQEKLTKLDAKFVHAMKYVLKRLMALSSAPFQFPIAGFLLRERKAWRW